MPVALITGSSTGIGEATALHLARMKHRVFASMRSPESGGAALREGAAKERLNLETVRLNVDDDSSVAACVADVIARAGRIDVLVNNAGINLGSSIEETTQQDLRAVMETNFFGAWRMMQSVLPAMRERRSGTIVNVSSISGRVAGGVDGAYAASKWALEAASEALAMEVKRFGIRVVIIEPGIVLTPIFDKMAAAPPPPPDWPYLAGLEPKLRYFASQMQHPAMPEEVAKVIDHAITTDAPKLRYPVGTDAVAILAARTRMSDEEWLMLGREMGEAEVVAMWKEFFGIDI